MWSAYKLAEEELSYSIRTIWIVAGRLKAIKSNCAKANPSKIIYYRTANRETQWWATPAYPREHDLDEHVAEETGFDDCRRPEEERLVPHTNEL